MHFGKVSEGTVRLGDTVEANVDPKRREDTARNHTATHMLHAALREVLGPHVRQAGSLVAPERLRFDFSHVQPVTDDELWQVQHLVNEKIRQNSGVHRDEDTYSSAIQRGALAFFGDRYGERVRLIEIANGDTFSFEVCGGTHVHHTGEVGSVYILGESSIGAGMRRLEAVSGRAAERLVWERFNREDGLASMLNTTSPELGNAVQRIQDENDDLRRQLATLERQNSLQAAEILLDSKQDINGVSVLSARTEASNSDSMREISDWLRDKMGSGIVVLGAVINDRPTISVGITRDLVDGGADARDYARDLGRIIGGGGGGRPDMAQAGGRNADKLDDSHRRRSRHRPPEDCFVRILALDVGDRRIGVALSDPLGILASPLTTIDRSTPDTEAAIDAVLALTEQHEAAEILVGIPYLMSGRIGAQARITLDLAQSLSERTNIPITHTDERLSSVQADRMLTQSGTSNTRDKGRTDSAAAAVILQAYLDARS